MLSDDAEYAKARLLGDIISDALFILDQIDMDLEFTSDS